MAHARHPGVTGLSAYYCPFGNGWHFGNLPPGGRDRARRLQKQKLKRKRKKDDSS